MLNHPIITAALAAERVRTLHERAAMRPPRRARNGSATRRAWRRRPEHIPAPTRIRAAGNVPKLIDEYVGRVTTGERAVSIAHMRSPSGWREAAQVPAFDEYTVVLRGSLRVEHDGGAIDVGAGEGIVARAGQRVRYSTPGEDGAEYVAVCLPAFTPEGVHRIEA